MIDPRPTQPARHIIDCLDLRSEAAPSAVAFRYLPSGAGGPADELTFAALRARVEHVAEQLRRATTPGARALLSLSGRPTLTTVFTTQEGRIGIYSLPRLSSHVYEGPRELIDECRVAIAEAARLGARCVSLTGLIPSATRYGEAIAESGPLPALVSTGHGTTSAAVVLSLLRALECSGRRLEQETVGFVGLGSIGRSVLRLMLKRLPHPRAITLSDVYSKSGSLAELERELRTRFEFRGALELAMGGSRASSAVYRASVIVCATNAPNVLEIGSVQPGTIIIDDSAPHCFDVATAMQRIDRDADILVTEGGMIRLPAATTQLLHWPGDQDLAGSEDVIRAVLARDPREIMGCMYSSLISARVSAIAPTLGLVDLESSVANFDYFLERGIQGANLHCEDVPIREEAIVRFARRSAGAADAGTREVH